MENNSQVLFKQSGFISWFFELSPRDIYEIEDDNLIIRITKFPSFRNEEETITLTSNWEVSYKPLSFIDGVLGWIFNYKNIYLTSNVDYQGAKKITLRAVRNGKKFYKILQKQV